jgi:hypothetical protein
VIFAAKERIIGLLCYTRIKRAEILVNFAIRINKISLKEYGSNVQKLVDHIKTIGDREKRTLYAHILVELMRQIHPGMKDNQDYTNKLWDDLYIISGFELDVDSPYPAPSKDVLGKKPLAVGYNQRGLVYRHYGRNLELLIQRAIETEDDDDRLAFVSYIFRLMRSFYSTWNKDNVEDTVLLEQLELISKGKLDRELTYIKEKGPIEASPKDRNSGFERQRGGQVTGYQSQTISYNIVPDRYNSISYNPGANNNNGGNNNNRNRQNNKFNKNRNRKGK